MTGNGLCGYALARSYTDSVLVALGAASLAIINPLVIQDINKTGLRQVTLWWLLLFVFLQRAGRTGHVSDGIPCGSVLCTGVRDLLVLWFCRIVWRLLGHLVNFSKKDLRGGMFFSVDISRSDHRSDWGLLSLRTTFEAGEDDQGQGGTEKLPELTFFLSYPAYDTVASAPQRPSNYRENVLSSLHRESTSHGRRLHLDPRHGVLAFH